jgi:hypothetical protein
MIRDIQHLTFTYIFHANPILWLFGATLPPTNEKTLSTHYGRLVSTIMSIAIKDVLHCKIVLKLRRSKFTLDQSLRYVGVTWLLFSIKHLLFGCVWLGVDLRTDIIKT